MCVVYALVRHVFTVQGQTRASRKGIRSAAPSSLIVTPAKAGVHVSQLSQNKDQSIPG